MQIDVPFRCRRTRFCDALDSNLLHQPLVVCLHRIEPIDHVVDAVRLVRCRIAQGEQRTKILQPFLCRCAFHGLRFVDDYDRVRLGDNVDRPTAAEFVEPHIDASRILALRIERLRIDDHDVDRVVGSKPIDLRELC